MPSRRPAGPNDCLALLKEWLPVFISHWPGNHPQLPHQTTSPVITKITTSATVATMPLILASDIGRFMA